MKKSKISIVQIFRLLVQIIFFIFLPALYINTFTGIKQIYLAIIRQNVSFTQLAPQLIEVIAIIPATIIMGRFFCGWMCGYGAFGDFIYKISNKVFKIKFKVNEGTDRVLKYFKYVLLVVLVFVICTFNITIFKSFNPWDVFGLVATVGSKPDFSYAATSLTVGLILFILISIGSVFIERFFCRYLCPLGAVFVIVSKLRIVKIKKERTKCGKCRICTNNCAMGIPLYKYNSVNSGECIDCMKCVAACPRKNVTLEVSGKDTKPLAAGIAVASVMTGLYYAGNIGVKAAGLTNTNSVASSQNTSVNNNYKDGTYEGSGTGFSGGTTKVSVVVKNGKITQITTVSEEDTPNIYESASSTVINEIISSQSTNVDAVAGATFSSKGIMQAVSNALSTAKASTNSVPSSNTAKANKTEQNTTSTGENQTQQGTSNQSSSNAAPASSVSQGTKYKDGTYQGSGSGFRGGTTTVSVVVKNGKITDVSTISEEDTPNIYESASNTVLNEIISSQSAVSGATYSSNGIMGAVKNALIKAE
ncbi:MAG: FMN-binding protein [Clostridium sp.]|nr:FMN-binding protein [Clostridium sp.]